MNTMPTPAALSAAMVRNRTCTSLAESGAVGSSMTITRARRDRARAISTSCCAPIPRLRTGRCGGRSRPTRASSARAFRSRIARRTKPSRPRGRCPRNTLSAIERSGTKLSSWWITTTPASSASRGRRGANGAPSSTISPSSGRQTPASTFISVLLPAPFSPTRPSTSPRWSVMPTRSSASTPGKRFEIARISRSGAMLGGLKLGGSVAAGHLVAPEAVILHLGAVYVGLGDEDVRPELVLGYILVAVQVLVNVGDRLRGHG